MVLLSTPTLDNTFKISDFKLISTDGVLVCLKKIKGKNGTLIMFICNHCPYVKAVIGEMVKIAPQIKKLGFGIAAIMPNDTSNYKEDSYENMKIFSKKNSFNFPYLLDDDQMIAKKYEAVCTPDFFCFNKDDILQYRGRILEMKNLTPLNPNKNELLNAIKIIATTGYGPKIQFPSIGCSIKWK
tara:strand:- start:525 stop:1076 length:552 start_codon:yes stop_codon:yes gene_type:complete